MGFNGAAGAVSTVASGGGMRQVGVGEPPIHRRVVPGVALPVKDVGGQEFVEVGSQWSDDDRLEVGDPWLGEMELDHLARDGGKFACGDLPDLPVKVIQDVHRSVGV